MIWEIRVSSPQLFLGLHCAAHGVHDARKLCKQVIPDGVHHAASVLFDHLAHDLPVGRQGGDGRFLIVFHEAAVALDISAENGGQLALRTFGTHGMASSEQRPRVEAKRRNEKGTSAANKNGHSGANGRTVRTWKRTSVARKADSRGGVKNSTRGVKCLDHVIPYGFGALETIVRRWPPRSGTLRKRPFLKGLSPLVPGLVHDLTNRVCGQVSGLSKTYHRLLKRL
jgi:hypothetical protein